MSRWEGSGTKKRLGATERSAGWDSGWSVITRNPLCASNGAPGQGRWQQARTQQMRVFSLLGTMEVGGQRSEKI